MFSDGLAMTRVNGTRVVGAARKFNECFVDGHPHSAGRGNDVEKTIPPDRERNAGAIGDFAANANGVAGGVRHGDQNLWLDSLALQRLLDCLLNGTRRCPETRMRPA